ncbi:Histone-lysine N-methyltransferase NSD3 [Phytophthora cinnamomi]|uniref:Histone-lysine N-methyltransferase NSD3 n=1 Tax=Phytophthora cinnamomi TaxID=4785 RepID=UPI003559F47D|nr:Histone-lysine N-methyltransferase NSD3 [Phytophthora cinnamomi]
MPDSLACPVCFEAFAADAGAAFALHVASCARASSSPSPPGSPPAAHCARCLHVYAAGALPHEISFHEHECARVNELPDDGGPDAGDAAAARKPKRARNGASAAAAVAAPRVTLFPSSCFLCGNGGRGLLHCGGSCARAAHQHCVDQLQAPAAGQPLSAAEKKQAAERWQCAQCLRGLHRCQRCGFLGHECNTMTKCSVLDCGFHFHAQCLPAQGEGVRAGFVCPRHTCASCGAQETDMRRCKSCSVCAHMTHLRCPRGAGQAGAAPTNGGLDPTNLFVCPRHDDEASTSPTNSPDASNSLRLRLAAGDVVLILEFNNALLPPTAKTAAPDAANYWGVVTSAEETEPHGHGNQLLSVRMFADDNVLVVPNQYALRVASASDFPRPVDLVRHCLQRHAMVELQLRQMEHNVDDAEVKRILRASNAAFAARLKALGVTEAQVTGDAELGVARWRRFLALPEPRQYDGLGDLAPSYLYVDTRGSRPGQQSTGGADTSETVRADADGDVPMTDADDTDSGAAAADGNGSTRSPKRVPSRPSSAGKSPHEASAEKPSDNEAPAAESNVMQVDTQLSQSPATSRANSPVQQSQTSTQDTVMASTQDTQHDEESWSQATSAGTLDVATPVVSKNAPAIPSGIAPISSDVNSSKRTSDAAEAEAGSAKRQKLDTETPVRSSAAVFTPTNYRGLVPGATLSSASAPATLHISPMASSARTVLPQKKRKQLTRKQKLLADMPPLVLEELEREAFRYLEDTERPKKKLAPAPVDADAFPWAARATSFRPAFYRPTVMLGHSGLRRPGVDAVSRLLVSQDKRSIKCFVQSVDEETGKLSMQCDHLSKNTSSASQAFVILDLLSLHSIRELEEVVRTRLVQALGKRSRYTREHFGMEAHQAQRWLEQQRRKKTGDQPPISLWYCSADGVRRHIKLDESSAKPSPKDKQAWLCFCANVCHLSVVIAAPKRSHSASTVMTAQPQQVSVVGAK